LKLTWVQNNNHYIAFDETGTPVGRVWSIPVSKRRWSCSFVTSPGNRFALSGSKRMRAGSLQKAKAEFAKRLENRIIQDAVARLTTTTCLVCNGKGFFTDPLGQRPPVVCRKCMGSGRQ